MRFIFTLSIHRSTGVEKTSYIISLEDVPVDIRLAVGGMLLGCGRCFETVVYEGSPRGFEKAIYFRNFERVA